MHEIKQWREIENDFRGTLLLGNGSSIALHDEFKYDSLFDAAVGRGYISDPVNTIFKNFGVYDFELVLKRLWQAKLVNSALGINSEIINQSYEQIRTALILTIRDVHISYDDASPHLEPIYKFMKNFKTVLTLNYDLIVYWAAMYSREFIGNWFKDCFTPNTFDEDWNRFKNPYGAKGSTLFFYPHGNLVLTRKDFANVYKISTANSEEGLLDEILSFWETGNYVPVFVCEGQVAQKMNSIYDASYMSRVYHEVLPSTQESLVIYGWKMAKQDQHILDQIARSGVSRVAVSVKDENQEFADIVYTKLQEIRVMDIHLFDAASEGCWNNPIEI